MNENLPMSDFQWHHPIRLQMREAIAKIEAVFENIADSLSNEENQCVPSKDIFIPLRYKKHATSNGDTPSNSNTEPAHYFTMVSFPARGRPREARRFSTTRLRGFGFNGADASPAVLIRILDLMHEALCENVIISKRSASILLSPPSQAQHSLNLQCRNIYYKDPALFKTQSTVDYYVDIIAYTFGVSRLALNVVSSQRHERH